MPSMSDGFSPASSIALRTAHVPIARVVLPEPRVYVVSPTPTIAYLSRRNLGVLASVSGSGMAFPLLSASQAGQDGRSRQRILSLRGGEADEAISVKRRECHAQ